MTAEAQMAYKDGARRLYEMMLAGKEDSDAAEELRCEMDRVWRAMTQEERVELAATVFSG